MKRSLVLTLAIAFALGAAAFADDAPGVPKVGFTFAKTSAVVREAPNDGAKEVGKLSAGGRYVFRRVVEPGPAWYRVEPPGGVVGWVSARDVSDKRPVAPPPGRPIEVKSSGVGMAAAASAQTAAARGLSKAASEYAAKNPDFKKAADHFVTLEGFVEAQFGDKHLENGNYLDVDVPGRIEHAETWKGGVK